MVACDVLEADQRSLCGIDRAKRWLLHGADVTQESRGWRGFISETRERFGRIDILYNNQRTMMGNLISRDHDAGVRPSDDDVNLRSVFLLSLYVAREMASAGRGSIVNVSSVGGIVGFPGMAAYGARKEGSSSSRARWPRISRLSEYV